MRRGEAAATEHQAMGAPWADGDTFSRKLKIVRRPGTGSERLWSIYNPVRTGCWLQVIFERT